mgnify:CR=1 FL=1
MITPYPERIMHELNGNDNLESLFNSKDNLFFIGKTHIKIILFDTINFKELIAYQTKNKILDITPYPHFDLDFIKSFIVSSIKKISKEFPVDTIFASTHGACLALLGKDKLILPVLDYEHDGPDEIRSEYDKTRLPFHSTGTPAMPAGLNLAAQIYWQNKRFPDEFAKVDTILFWPQYWSYWLCGVAASEISFASSHSDLWNINESQFIDLKNYGIGTKVKFPKIRSASEILGPIKKNLAQEMGLSKEIMIYCGGHDSSLTLASAYLNYELPITVISTGTWITVFSIGKNGVNVNEQKGVMVSCDCFGNEVPNFRFPGGKIYENHLKRKNEFKKKNLELSLSDIELINFEDTLIPIVHVRDNIEGFFNRSTYYNLINFALENNNIIDDTLYISSGNKNYPVGKIA